MLKVSFEIMKSIFNLCIICTFWVAVSGAVSAATLSGAGTRETLIEQEDLSFLSLGVDYQNQQRDINTSSQGKLRLKSQTLDGYIGVDPFKWLTVFATLGGTAGEVSGMSAYNDPKFQWSAGFDVNWWRHHLEEPDFLAGELSLKTHAEFGMHNSGSDSEKVNWDEYFAALLLNYETLAVRGEDPHRYPHSLVLFAGPGFSWLSGNYYQNPTQKADFHEAHVFGVVGGLELFVASNLSLGGAIQYYDAVTVNVSARYHF